MSNDEIPPDIVAALRDFGEHFRLLSESVEAMRLEMREERDQITERLGRSTRDLNVVRKQLDYQIEGVWREHDELMALVKKQGQRIACLELHYGVEQEREHGA